MKKILMVLLLALTSCSIDGLNDYSVTYNLNSIYEKDGIRITTSPYKVNISSDNIIYSLKIVDHNPYSRYVINKVDNTHYEIVYQSFLNSQYYYTIRK
jgi:hypothetical protein